MKHLKISLFTFYDEAGNILLNHRYDHQQAVEDVWELMGGGIDGDEQPIDTIKREIAEELNYKIDEEKDRLVLVRKFEIEKPNFTAEVYFFKAKFPGFDRFSDSDEVKVSDLKLLPVKTALTLPLLPICREILLTLE